MRITILAPGSRGDVQPFAALGGALVRAGHEVRIVADGGFGPLMRLAEVEHVPVSGDIRSLLQAEQKLIFEKGRNPVALARGFFRVGRDLALRWGEEGLAACRGADLILTGDGAVFFGASVAEKFGIPLVQGYLQPLPPTREFPNVLIPPPGFALPGWVNRLSHRLVGDAFWLALRPGTNAVRTTLLGLPPWPALRNPIFEINRHSTAPVLFGFSPGVVPRPADWPPQCRLTGYWFLDHPDWRMPPEQAAFLAAGPPPVYVGFGSMGTRDPRETTALVLEALKRAGGLRAVLAAGWGGLSQAGDVPDTILMIEEAPHDRLLPHMAAAVHHGGAGTTAAALRAGIPSVVLPVLGDQSFWGARLAALGAAPPPLPRRRVTADALAAALRRVITDAPMRARAEALGTAIRAEDGLTAAVELIEEIVASAGARPPRHAGA